MLGEMEMRKILKQLSSFSDWMSGIAFFWRSSSIARWLFLVSILLVSWVVSDSTFHRMLVRSVLASQAAESFSVQQHEIIRPGTKVGYFEENRGQADGRVRYLTRGGNSEMFLTTTGAVYIVRGSLADDSDQNISGKTDISLHNQHRRSVTNNQKAVAVYSKWVGANPNANFVALEQLEHRTNYFIGSDPINWQVEIPNYGRVMAENIYDGIDVIWRDKEAKGAQFDFVVKPNADPSQIEWEIEGAKNVEIDTAGNLAIETAFGQIEHASPSFYFVGDGYDEGVRGSFSVRRVASRNQPSSAAFRVTFDGYAQGALQTPEIGRSANFSELSYSTFIGGNGTDDGQSIAVDSSGSTYIVGATRSTQNPFPTSPGVFDTTHNGGSDAFVTKLNPSGSALIYSTFLGSQGSDSGSGIAIDSTGNAYLTGFTSGANFPTTPGAFDTTSDGVNADVFITKLNSSGSALIYSTFVGGNGNADRANGIALDTMGNVFIAGFSESPSYPTTPGAFDTTFNSVGGRDCVITKVNSSGSALLYSSYLGGSSGDECFGLTTDSNGNAYLAGRTDSSDYPTTLGAFDSAIAGIDAFVTKVTPDGSALVFSTYLGGGGEDGAFKIVINDEGMAYVTGYTFGATTPFPTTAGAYDTSHNGFSDIFVTKLNPGGSELTYSTFIGGGSNDSGLGLVRKSVGSVVVTGGTNSTDFPTTDGAFDTTQNGDYDVVITEIDSDGSTINYSTFIGGTANETGRGIAADPSGNAYVTGDTAGIAFPTTPGAFDTISNGNPDVFVVKLGTSITPTPTATPSASPTPQGFESDVAPRETGDGSLIVTDLVQIRRFVAGLDSTSSSFNEFQRADSAPRGTFGDGLINTTDVVQARRYVSGLDERTNAGGPAVAADLGLRAVIGGSLFGAKVEGQGLLRLVSGKGGAVVVELVSGSEVAAVSFRLRYDAELGKPLVSLGDLPDGTVLTVNDTVEGELTVLIDSAEPLGKSLRLVSIGFEKKAVGSVELVGLPSASDLFGNEVLR